MIPLPDGDKMEVLALEYEGDLKEMPYKMLFGFKECTRRRSYVSVETRMEHALLVQAIT
jgi:hypothetical protein